MKVLKTLKDVAIIGVLGGAAVRFYGLGLRDGAVGLKTLSEAAQKLKDDGAETAHAVFDELNKMLADDSDEEKEEEACDEE